MRLMRITIPLVLILASLGAYAQSPAVAVTPGLSYKDCAECPEMVAIPGGEFVMGAMADEEERELLSYEFRNRSAPQHQVKIRGLSVGKYEITRGQYRVFAESTGRSSAGCFIWSDGDYRMDSGKSWRNPGYPQDETHPVSCVSWEDATAYVQWLHERTGKPYRLLTEAEWEYAARAGTTASRFWGDDGNRSCSHANGADQKMRSQIAGSGSWPSFSCDDGYVHTAPVGRYRANAYGLHDMLGNAAEWTADCWNGSYRDAPTDGRAWTGGDCFLRAVRGGGWDEGPPSLRSAYRVGSPVVIRVYARGFRVARQDQ